MHRVPTQPLRPPRRPLGHALLWIAVTACLGLISTLMVAPAEAAFRGRNGRIAYVNTLWHGDEPDNEIFSIRPGGAGKRRLTFRGSNDNLDWAPFGHRIVYLHTPKRGRTGIWIMGANGGNKRLLVPGSRRVHDSAPAWAPDGKHIVFVRRSPGARTDLMVYSLASRTIRALHVGRKLSLVPDAPAWSPNGRTIAFSVLDISDPDAFDYQADLFTVHRDGSHLTRITNTYRWSEHNPDWSPSGRLLVYERHLTAAGFSAGKTCEEEIDIVKPDGAGRRRVRAGCMASMPAWSPNGRRILVYAVIGNRSGVWTMAPTGARRRYVASGIDGHWQPLKR